MSNYQTLMNMTFNTDQSVIILTPKKVANSIDANSKQSKLSKNRALLRKERFDNKARYTITIDQKMSREQKRRLKKLKQVSI